MKKSLLIIGLFAIVSFFGCQNEKEQQAREKQIHDSFAQLMSAKDGELESLFQELNDIDSSLNEVTNKYSKVSKVANSTGEISKDTKSRIKSNIETINNLLSENRRKIANVNAKMNKNNKENQQLKNFVQSLEARILEQEQQIQALNAELAKKNIQIDNLTKDVADLNSKTKNKDAQIMKIEDDDLIICRCEEISLGEIRKAIKDGARDVSAVKRRTRAGMGLCQGRTCEPMIQGIIKYELRAINETAGGLTARFPHRPIKFSVLGGISSDE